MAASEPQAEKQEANSEWTSAYPPLGLGDFYSPTTPAVQLSTVLICLALRLLFPASYLVTAALLKLKLLQPTPGSEDLAIVAQTKVFFKSYAALLGVAVPFMMACNIGGYYAFTSYRHTGPPCAVWFPWLASCLSIPANVASIATLSKDFNGAMHRKFMRILVLIARECGESDETIRQLEKTTQRSSLENISAGRYVARKRKIILTSKVKHSSYAELYKELSSLETIEDLQIELPSGDDVSSGKVLIRSIKGVIRSWPSSDRFLNQQQRVHNLSNVMLCMKSEKVPTAEPLLLPSYFHSLEGPMAATDFANQMCISPPNRLSLLEKVLIGLPFSISCGLFLFFSVGACGLAWRLFSWVDGRQKKLMFGVFVAWGLVDGVLSCMAQLLLWVSALTKRLAQLKAFNAMLCGAHVASQQFLPVMRVNVPSDLLVWAEVQELCLARHATRQLRMDMEALAATVLALSMATCTLCFALEENWQPGLLSLIALYSLLMYIAAAVPFFVAGVLVNMERARTLTVLSQFGLQAQIALEQPGLTDEVQRQQIQKTVSMASQLIQQIRSDSSQDINILGIRLTAATASAMASAMSTVVAISMRSLPLTEIWGKIQSSYASSHIWRM
ncbi:unnamed protein product [Symbiodinium natans]|uniref:Uncharacterized protein n=1 Tax=Symbiodinium natans TaxID=878477 RepID=A0A812S773_9DINO|nr:unnamed protein product [Symbiodinium natans]